MGGVTDLPSEIGGYKIVGPLAYRGKPDCQHPLCTRMILHNDDGTYAMGECMGWHCSYCDEPCSSQGHRCDAAETMLGEARRIIEEQP